MSTASVRRGIVVREALPFAGAVRLFRVGPDDAARPPVLIRAAASLGRTHAGVEQAP